MRPSRRAFLIGSGLVGGGLLIGVGGVVGSVALHDRLAVQQALIDGRMLALWLALHPDGRIELLSPHTEMGQGANTGLRQIVAEELDVRLDQIEVSQAPADPAFANGVLLKGFVQAGFLDGEEISPILDGLFTNAMHLATEYAQLQITGGSASIRFTGWRSMRRGAALARLQLIAAAAEQWGIDAAELRTEDGEVVSPDGERLAYGVLAESAAQQAIPDDVALKTRDQWRHIGTSAPRFDLPDKVFGRAEYGIDRHVEGLQYAAVRNVAVLGGTVRSVDNEDELLARRGVSAVHVLDEAVVVIADNPWRAEQAVRAAKTDESAPEPQASTNTETLKAAQLAALDTGPLDEVDVEGDPEAVLSAGGSVIEATYDVPFLAHAPLEPMNATVWEEDGRVHVACGVQNPLSARAICAERLGRPLEEVVFHAHTMGGGFGRRGGGLAPGVMNYLDQAVRIWDAARVPIKMTWSREQDMKAGLYRNLAVGRYRATLGDDGLPDALEARSYGAVVAPSELLPLYAIPNRSFAHVDARQFVPWTAWRSVDASIYGFFLESFVDELAEAAGEDPLEYRIRLLERDASRPLAAHHAVRMAAVLREVRDFSGWTPEQRGGRAMGVGAVHSFGSYVAQVASVSVEDGKPVVHDVWAVVDCGVAVNPDAVEAQLQGGMIFGLTAARYGRVDIEGGRIVQSNFHDYPMVRLADAPQLHVRILNSDADPGGAGEVGVPPIAPAVANALARLQDRRRSLPVG